MPHQRVQDLMPSGIKIDTSRDDLTITRRWFSPSAFSMSLVPLGLLCYFDYRIWYVDEIAWSSIVFLPATAVSLCHTLTLLLNTTQLRI